MKKKIVKGVAVAGAVAMAVAKSGVLPADAANAVPSVVSVIALLMHVLHLD
jgi:hypothetical protein